MMKDFFFFSSLFSLLLLSSLHFGNGQEVVTKPKRHLREEERVQYELTTKFVRQREDRSLSDKYFEPQKKKKEKKQEEEDISFRVEKNFGTDPILSEKRFENVANFPAFRDLCKDGEKSSPFGLGFWANSLRIPVKSYSSLYFFLKRKKKREEKKIQIIQMKEKSSHTNNNKTQTKNNSKNTLSYYSQQTQTQEIPLSEK